MPKSICPICKKVFDGSCSQADSFYPFCGEHCRMVDLGRWFTDGYVIEGRGGNEGEDDGGGEYNALP